MEASMHVGYFDNEKFFNSLSLLISKAENGEEDINTVEEMN